MRLELLSGVLFCGANLCEYALQQTVWQSQVFARFYFLVHIFCWGAPAIPVILAYLSNSFRYTFGTFCLVSPKQSGALLFWPMVALLGPAMMVHLITTVWILKAKKAISNRSAEGVGAEWSGNGGGTRRWSGSGMQYSVTGGPASHGQYSGNGLQHSGTGLQYSGNGQQYSGGGLHYSGNNTFQGSVVGVQYSVNDMQPYLGTYGVDEGRGGSVRDERQRDAAVKIVGVAAVQWRIMLLSVGKMCILLAYYVSELWGKLLSGRKYAGTCFDNNFWLFFPV